MSNESHIDSAASIALFIALWVPLILGTFIKPKQKLVMEFLMVGRHTTLVMHSSSGKSLIQISSQYSFVIKTANDMAGNKGTTVITPKRAFY